MTGVSKAHWKCGWQECKQIPHRSLQSTRYAMLEWTGTHSGVVRMEQYFYKTTSTLDRFQSIPLHEFQKKRNIPEGFPQFSISESVLKLKNGQTYPLT